MTRGGGFDELDGGWSAVDATPLVPFATRFPAAVEDDGWLSPSISIDSSTAVEEEAVCFDVDGFEFLAFAIGFHLDELEPAGAADDEAGVVEAVTTSPSSSSN